MKDLIFVAFIRSRLFFETSSEDSPCSYKSSIQGVSCIGSVCLFTLFCIASFAEHIYRLSTFKTVSVYTSFCNMPQQMGLWATLTSRARWETSDDPRMLYNNHVARVRKNEYPMLKGNLALSGRPVPVLTKQYRDNIP
jgi:hypothetical protein